MNKQFMIQFMIYRLQGESFVYLRIHVVTVSPPQYSDRIKWHKLLGLHGYMRMIFNPLLNIYDILHSLQPFLQLHFSPQRDHDQMLTR